MTAARGEIRLSGRHFNKPVLLHKDSASLSKWLSLSELTPDNLLSDVKADDYPEILIIGTGAVQKFYPSQNHGGFLSDRNRCGMYEYRIGMQDIGLFALGRA